MDRFHHPRIARLSHRKSSELAAGVFAPPSKRRLHISIKPSSKFFHFCGGSAEIPGIENQEYMGS
jgi:hypothetical protein